MNEKYFGAGLSGLKTALAHTNQIKSSVIVANKQQILCYGSQMTPKWYVSVPRKNKEVFFQVAKKTNRVLDFVVKKAKSSSVLRGNKSHSR